MSLHPPKSRLDQISTRWESVRDPVQFVLRYAPAIERFLGVLVRNADDAAEVSQEFLLGVMRHGFPQEKTVRGRFRDYLIAAVRNAARGFFRRRSPRARDNAILEEIPDHQPGNTVEREWLDSWRQCLLDRVWEALENHQQKQPRSQFYAVLRLAVEHPDQDSRILAARIRSAGGRKLRADAFRKQLSRARRKFAQLVVEEVARTLIFPTPQAIEEELSDLGLLVFVRGILPPDWGLRVRTSLMTKESQ